jgi:hypothetical protein
MLHWRKHADETRSLQGRSVQSNKVLNLSAFAFDLLMGCICAALVFSFVTRTLEQLAPATFRANFGFGQLNDFRAYYAFGKLAQSGTRSSLYEPPMQKQFFCNDATPPGQSCEDFAYIPYAPFFALVMLPFAQMKLNVSYVFWEMLSIALFAGAAILLAFAPAERPSKFAPYAIVLGALASIPALRNIILGQSAFLIGAGMAAFYYCWMTGRERLAGVFAALTTFKPQFITFMLLPALAQKRWQIFVGFAVAEVVLWLAAGLFLGGKPLTDYFLATRRVASFDWDETFTMLCLLSFFHYLPHTLTLILWIGTFTVSVAFIGWLWYRSPALSRDPRSCRLVAATIVVSLLTSLYTQLYDAILLLLPAILTLRVAGCKNLFGGSPARKMWWFLLYGLPIVSWAVWLSLGRDNPWTYHFFTLALVFLSIVSLLQLLIENAFPKSETI